MSSVGEVVVSGGHVVESSGGRHFQNTAIEVWCWSTVEEGAISWIGFFIVVGGGFKGFFSNNAKGWIIDWLADSGESEGLFVTKEGWTGAGDGEESGFFRTRTHWEIGGESVVFEHHDVRSISSGSSFTSISSRVEVTASPLEVDHVSLSDGQVVRDEIVFSGRVSLDNVSSLSSDVQVVESVARDTISRVDVEDMGSVLEGSAELRGINGQSNVGTILQEDIWVSVDRGVKVRVRNVDGVVSVAFEFSSRDIVSDSENTVAVVSINAVFVSSSRKGPVESVGETSNSVSKMVVSVERRRNTSWWRKSVGIDGDPVVSHRRALNFVVVLRR